MPFFCAEIADPSALSSCFFNGGYGCHPRRDIALVRALCEAAQSRLGLIHGGRDDLDEMMLGHARRREASSDDNAAAAAADRDGLPRIAYEDTPDWSEQADGLALSV